MKKHKGVLLAVILTATLWLVYFSFQLINADRFNYGGDGFKNYYTLAYYLRYDSGSHFSGMNYPYGENIPFTDNQPALAWILKPFVKLFPAIAGHIRLVIISLIFLSVILSAIFTFKTLREFDVSEIPAVVFAALITMLSPQIQRLSGHFSLAYICFLPIIIYQLVRVFMTKGGARYFVWLTITLTFFSFIHIYYLAMAGMYIILIAILFALYHLKNLKGNIRFVALLAGCAIVPFVILKTYLLLTDHIRDRPDMPWGFVESRSTVADILLHNDSFTGEVISKWFPKAPIEYTWEGIGYIGLVAVITLFSVLIALIISPLLKTKAPRTLFIYPLNIFLPAATMVLLFAMAFPFSIDPLQKYFELMPGMVKQFRASGRFNWVFYYTATLTTSVILYTLFSKILVRSKITGYAFFLLVITIWFIEVNMISNRCEKNFNRWIVQMDEAKEGVRFANLLKASSHSPDDFQAIMPLPFFLNGSEKLYIVAWSEFASMKTSLLSGLPIVCGEMSRTSLSQTLKIANLLSNDLLNKEVLKGYHNQKPLLLLVQGTPSPEERRIVDRGKFLFGLDDITYYELPISAFDASAPKIKQYFADNRSKFFRHDDYWSTDSIPNVLIRRFESEPKDYAVFGKGACYVPKGAIYFYCDTLPNAKDGGEYEFSIWFYSDKRTCAYPVVTLNQTEAYTGKEYWTYECNGKFSTNNFGNWVRVDYSFTLLNRKNKIYIGGNGIYASYDELMVRPKSENVISAFTPDSLFNYNNFPIR